MRRRIERFMHRPRVWVLGEGFSIAMVLKVVGFCAIAYAAVAAVSLLPIG